MSDGEDLRRRFGAARSVKSGSDSFAQLLTYSHGLGGNEQNADLREKIAKAGLDWGRTRLHHGRFTARPSVT